LAGIDKKISNKFARKTGATFLSSIGLETHFLKKIMGHTKESTTYEYLYIAAKEVSARVNRMDLSQVDF
jgi:site-specific recombinase XerD